MTKRGLDVKDRFWMKVEKTDECWNWTAGSMGKGRKGGYGAFKFSPGVVRLAHRVSYEWENGPIPEGLELDHLCSNRLCVRPDHLEAVTHRDNLLRGNAPAAHQARQTHCIHGHELTPENVYQRGNKRQCRSCALRYAARQRAALKKS